jgi:small subunit ribosomal protein S9
MTNTAVYSKAGSRKDAIARTMIIKGGTGKVVINDKDFEDYFKGLPRQQKLVRQPFEVYPAALKYDFYVKVAGGGISGQAGAIRHCLSRAILSLDESARSILRKEGLLTRDPRMVERKKPGRPKARKRFQFSKR